eukprot:SAG31_NODE_31902_length_362_cov_1.178707_1_plen_97_part_10
MEDAAGPVSSVPTLQPTTTAPAKFDVLRAAISTVGLDTLGDDWKEGVLRVIAEIEGDAEQISAELQDLKLSELCADVGAVTHAHGHRHKFVNEEVEA